MLPFAHEETEEGMWIDMSSTTTIKRSRDLLASLADTEVTKIKDLPPLVISGERAFEMNKTYVDPRCPTCGDPVDLFCSSGHGHVPKPLEGFRRSDVSNVGEPEKWLDVISERLKKFGNFDPTLVEMLQERAIELVGAALSFGNMKKELEILKLKPEVPDTYLYQIAVLKDQIMTLRSQLREGK